MVLSSRPRHPFTGFRINQPLIINCPESNLLQDPTRSYWQFEVGDESVITIILVHFRISHNISSMNWIHYWNPFDRADCRKATLLWRIWLNAEGENIEITLLIFLNPKITNSQPPGSVTPHKLADLSRTFSWTRFAGKEDGGHNAMNAFATPENCRAHAAESSQNAGVRPRPVTSLAEKTKSESNWRRNGKGEALCQSKQTSCYVWIRTRLISTL